MVILKWSPILENATIHKVYRLILLGIYSCNIYLQLLRYSLNNHRVRMLRRGSRVTFKPEVYLNFQSNSWEESVEK